MPETVNPHRVITLTPARQILVTFLDLSAWGHSIFGFVEVDVTDARRWLAAYEAATGEQLSFTGYLVYCLAQAIDADKSVQAYRKGRQQLVLFDDVDVGLMIEHKFSQDRPDENRAPEDRAPIGYVLRGANRKSFLDIHREIRARQAATPERREMPRWMRVALGLPGPLPRLMVGLMRRQMQADPAGKWVAMAGTVGLSAVGMFGEGGGWGLGEPDRHTLSVIVGGIATRPAYVGERVEPREFLSLTLTFNHDVVDGAPAARFTQRLKGLIEGACGLEELEVRAVAPT